MTGRLKVRPSSATIGGRGGTGSLRCSISGAAASNEGSPYPLTPQYGNAYFGRGYGSDQIFINSNWGVSDPLAVPKTAQLMRERGIATTARSLSPLA
jgi:hypothetical protein